MKKNVKAVTAIVAALLAIAPIVSASQTVKADDADEPASEEIKIDGRTFASFKHFYFDNIQPVDPATDHYVTNQENGEVSISVANKSIMLNGKQMINATGMMPSGTYHATADVRIIGFDQSSVKRVISLRAGNHPIGEMTIPANSSAGTGYLDFSVTIQEDGVADSPVFNKHVVKKNVIKKHIAKKHATKKHIAKRHAKKVVKKHSKKHVRRNRR